MDTKRYLDVQEVSEYLGISRWTIYKLVQDRRIPFIPISMDTAGPAKKNWVRFDVREIDRWMSRRAVVPLKMREMLNDKMEVN